MQNGVIIIHPTVSWLTLACISAAKIENMLVVQKRRGMPLRYIVEDATVVHYRQMYSGKSDRTQARATDRVKYSAIGRGAEPGKSCTSCFV